MTSRWAGPVIALTFLTAMIAIGHGIAPLAFLLVISTVFLIPVALVGWIAVLLLFFAAIRDGRARTLLVWIGSVISFAFWLYLFWDSDRQSTFLVSVHYFVAMFYFLVYWPLVHPRDEASDADSSDFNRQ